MFARHDLVWLSHRGWQRVRATVPSHDAAAIDTWREANWPAIVRRSDADLLPDQLSLGITLPPNPLDGSKTRIGFRVSVADVDAVVPPLPVAQVTKRAPEPWRPLLAELDRHAALHGLCVRVYGSLALHALTGQAYLTPASDIDVLLHPATLSQLYCGLNLLNVHAAGLPLDGEIVFPQGQAVAWRELCVALGSSSQARVLVKAMQRVSLASTSGLLATIEDHLCRS